MVVDGSSGALKCSSGKGQSTSVDDNERLTLPNKNDEDDDLPSVQMMPDGFTFASDQQQ